jgi:predicted ester cyclase
VISDLPTVYRDYLACLNARRWDELWRFVAEEVVHNGKTLGLSGYQAMLVADTDATPDLQYVPEILIADGDFVACRLYFQCTPQHEFLGLEPAGRRISFAEHVFYRFADGRIAEVWSLIDKDAIRAQLSPAQS